MPTELNTLQSTALQMLDDFAQRFSCVKAVYLFGSVARGETDGATDIDIFFEYVDGMAVDDLGHLPPHEIGKPVLLPIGEVMQGTIVGETADFETTTEQDP